MSKKEVYELTEVVQLKSGTTVKKELERDYGDVAYLKVSGMNQEGNETKITTSDIYLNFEDINTKNILPVGSTIFPKRGGAIATNKKRITDIPLCIDLNTMGVIPQSELAIPEYIYYFFQSFDLISISSGTTIPQINNYSFDGIKLFAPPLPEQKRIAAILDQAFADIDRARELTERNLHNARELFESYLQQMFSQRGDGWEEKTIKDLSTVLGDGLHGTPKYDPDGEYFFINGNNLNDGKIEIKEKTKRISKEEYENHKKPLCDRTVLVSINGTLGNVAFYHDEKVALGKSACYFNLIESINKDYVKFLIESPLFQEYAQREATGATIKNVSLRSMRAFLVPFPSIEDQEKIVSKLKNLKGKYLELERIYSQKLDALGELKKSLLQKAFSGELTNNKDAA